MQETLVTLSYFVNSFENPFAFMTIVAGCAFLVAYFNREQSLAFFLSLGSSFALANVLKHIYKIARPVDALATLDSYRFPSMHAVLVSALAVSFWWFVWKKYKNTSIRISATAVAVALILFVSYSRIVLNVHEPVDVIVGAMIGSGITLLVHYFLSKR